MEAVRDKMMELESFNEAIELLRGIMDSEKKLQDEVRKRQKEKLRDLQEDDK
jgi:predicted HicB family RNase H-like nuclease